MEAGLRPLIRITVFYDGQYFFHVSNYYAYQHSRRSRISIGGLHGFICQEVAAQLHSDASLCRIVDAHYFRGRLSAPDADSSNRLYNERVFDDILMSENVVTHYMPLRKGSSGGRLEKGVDVSLALEALEMAVDNKYDIAVLIACDGDYIPLIRKLNARGLRVMLLSWDFAFSDECGVERETRTSPTLLKEVLYPIRMHEVIDDPKRSQDPVVQNLFLLPSHEHVPAGVSPAAEQEATEGEIDTFESYIFVLKEGYGFIKYEPNNLFFHYSAMMNCDFNDLQVGMLVRFNVMELEDGRSQAGMVWMLEG